MAEKITIYGPQGSSYVRTVRLTLEEKGVAHELVELPMPDYKGDDYLGARHPFGKVPAVEIDGFKIYETQAIVRLIDELYPEPPLQPADPFERARMSQILNIVDWYGWPSMAAGIIFNRYVRPCILGIPGDEAELAAALPMARTSMAAIDELKSGSYLVGDRLTLADLFVYPILDYLRHIAEGVELMKPYPQLAEWLARMDARQSSQLLLAA